MRRLSLLLALCLLCATAAAFEPFKVTDIRVEGLRRIAAGTVFNYLPVQVGDRLDERRAASAIRALYDTGFFQDVTLQAEDGVLIVEVVERPAVARIELSGNEQIPSEGLLEALKGVGLAEGQVFNRSLLAAVERELQQQYFGLGYYDVRITSTVSPLERNRVTVRIDVEEGEPASVQPIQFVGNQRYADDDLRDLFEMGPVSWYAFWSSADRYSQQKLAADLEQLRAFYQDDGFINFTITSTQVSITPDRRRIYITVNLSEGEQYRFDQVDLAGELVLAEEELRELVTIEPGALYSRQQVTATSNAIRERMGEVGYAFANVNPVPTVNEEERTVDLAFFVDPADRVYVRRINITGNATTRDEVIRREMRQQESAWLSTEDVKESRRRLNRLGFFEEVNIETPRVPGSTDQVDVEVGVKERLLGSLQAGLGFGTTSGLLLSLSVQQDNVLGTGDRLAFTASNDSINTVYRLSYLERFHTRSGINRNMSASYRDTDASEANLADFGVTSLGLEYGYQVPISPRDRIDADLNFESLTLDLSDNPTDLQQEYVDANGRSATLWTTTLRWVRDSRDRAIFPTDGARQTLSTELAVPGTEVDFYRISYEQQRFVGLLDWLTLAMEVGAGFGSTYGEDERLPFFKNFFAGGINSVRGYSTNSLGPRDENNDPTGGNARAVGSAQLLAPPPIEGADSVRFGVFVDGGQVYDTTDEAVNFTDLRYSAGVSLSWLSPLGPLTMSLARPLNEEPGDETQFFQFTFGSIF